MTLRTQLTALLSFLFLSLLTTTSSVSALEEGEVILNNELTRANNQSLLWGPYRPNLYFGVRPRIPKSLISALLWAKVDDYATVQDRTLCHFNIRYTLDFSVELYTKFLTIEFCRLSLHL